MSKPILIGVAGGSCSGKTTFSQFLFDAFGKENCQLIWQDNYYIDQSAKFDHYGGSVNFDHPSAIDFNLLTEQLSLLKSGESVNSPIYDFATHTRQTSDLTLCPKSVIITDGILIFHNERLRDLFDYRYYISAPENVRFERRLKRDTSERGRTEQGVKDQFFNQVAPMHDEFVSPTKNFAHRVITQEDVSTAQKEIIQHLKDEINFL